MKQLFTLLTLLLLTFNFNAQDFDHLSPESIEDLFILENQPNSSITQVDLRSPFGLDSAYFYILPADELSQKRYFTYNDLGSTMSHSTIRLNTSNNVWENYRKLEYVRDANDIITVFTYFIADPNTLEWVADYRYDYTIDANGNRIQSVQSDWNSTTASFDDNLKWEYNFDTDNILIDRYISIWNANINDWGNFQYSTYTYDSDGKPLEEILQIWLLNTYNNNSKRVYEYDLDQNLISITYHNWDAVFLIWVNNLKVDFIYVNDILVAEYTYSWLELPSGFDWANDKLTQFSYDGNGNKTEDRYSVYNFDNEIWEGNRRWVYNYSDLETSTQTLKNTSLTCYLQNPLRTGEMINCQDLDWNKNYHLLLFNVSGKVLLEKSFQGDLEIELPSNLRNGMYFMNVLEEGRLVLKEKVVVID
jgi:hypothetical protein